MIRSFLAAALLAVALPAAAVSFPEQGLQADPRRAIARAGGETRHPLAFAPARLLAAKAGGRVLLPGRDAPVAATVQRLVEHGDGRRSWVGTVDTAFGPQSAVVTFDDAGNVFGFVPQPQGLPLRLETRRGEAWLVDGVGDRDDARDLRRDVRVPPPATGPVPKAAGGAVPKVVVPGLGQVPLVDVLVAYTPGLVAVWGSEDAVRTRIAFLETLSNQVYVDSLAGLQIRIVATYRFDTTLPASNDSVLDLISVPAQPANAAKVALDAARFNAGADLVVLLREATRYQGSCGVAWLLGKPHWRPDRAFAVVSDHSLQPGDDCWEISFTHEIGHILGSHHDNATSGGEYGAWIYSRGHRATVGAAGFATVMAYPAAGQDYVARLSNPQQAACLGQPCGVVDFADNARSHTGAAPTVAGFLATKTAVPAATLRIADAAVDEGDGGGRTPMTFVVERGGDTTTAVSFALGVLPDGATPGDDFVPPAATRVVIAAGQTSLPVTIEAIADEASEHDERFVLVLTAIDGALATDAVAVGTIRDDDPGFVVDDLRVGEGAAGERTVLATVRLSQALPAPATFRIVSEPIPHTGYVEAEAGEDYTAVDHRGTIPAGALSATVPIAIAGDRDVEGDEKFVLRIVESGGGAGILAPTAIVAIVNDDVDIGFRDMRASLLEGSAGATPASIALQASPVSFAYEIGYVLEDGTATVGADVGPATGTLRIEPGWHGASLPLQLQGDLVDEAHETFRIRLVSADYDVGSPLTVTIADDDGAPALAVDDVSVAEGSPRGDRVVLPFTVRLLDASAEAVFFDIALVHETTDAQDLWNSWTSASILPGETEFTFEVEVQRDHALEPDETFRIELGNVRGAAIADGVATGTIRNDDNGGPVLDVYASSEYEGPPGANGLLRFHVYLDRAGTAPITARVRLEGRSATIGVDTAASAVFPTIPAGQTEAWIELPIVGDGDVEEEELLFVHVEDLQNASPGSVSAYGAIRNDDYPEVSIGELQGRGATAARLNQQVSIEGIVTASSPDGYYLQSAPGSEDGDPATSDAVFVPGYTDWQPFVRGDRLRVGGWVGEQGIDYHPNLPTRTVVGGIVQKISSGNPLPAPVRLDAEVLHPALPPGAPERLESMRVSAPVLRVVDPFAAAPPQYYGVAPFPGRFHAVLDGVGRPFHRGGLSPLSPAVLPAGVVPPAAEGAGVRVRIDSNGQNGTAPIVVDAGDRLEGVEGVLDQRDGKYALLPDPGRPLAVVSGATPRALAPARAGDLTIATLHLGPLFDDVDDAVWQEPLATADAYARELARIARASCEWMRQPDVVAVIGVENPAVLADVADAMNGAADGGDCAAAPGYEAAMPDNPAWVAERGQVGFLVRAGSQAAPRIAVREVLPVAWDTLFAEISANEPLFDRPPVALRFAVHGADGTHEYTALAVAFAEASGSDSPHGTGWGFATRGELIRTRRLRQAAAVATWVQARQQALPQERLLVLGDFDAPERHDGLVDVVGLVAGRAAPATQVLLAAPSPVQRPLDDAAARMPEAERYTGVVDGDATLLDHVLLSRPLLDAGLVARLGAVRLGADFGGDHADTVAPPLRLAARDPLVLTLSDPRGTQADLAVWFVAAGSGATADGGGRVLRVQNRGTDPALRPRLQVTVDVAPAAVKAPAAPGWTCTVVAAGAGSRVDCVSEAPLAAGATVEFVLRAAGATAADASVASDSPDVRPGNDRDTWRAP